MAKKLPSPCIDVCKFRRAGHCTGCSMTKAQKKMFDRLPKRDRQAFVELLLHQQRTLGNYAHWKRVYAKKCAKKGAPPLGAALLDLMAPGGD